MANSCLLAADSISSYLEIIFPALHLSHLSSALQRHWESCSTDLHPPGDSSVFDFSVMSYNILSQQLLEDNAYLYRHCDPDVLPWEYRLHNLLAEIQHHNADVRGCSVIKRINTYRLMVSGGSFALMFSGKPGLGHKRNILSTGYWQLN